MFQPRRDEIGGKVRMLSIEKFGDTFMSSDLAGTATEQSQWTEYGAVTGDRSPSRMNFKKGYMYVIYIDHKHYNP